MTTPASSRGSIGAGLLWMSGLALLLIWLPVLGPVIAGFVGGKKAGSVFRAFVAAIIPSVVLTILAMIFTTMLSGVPIIGVLAGFGTMIFLVGNIGPMLLAALIGGAMA